MAYLQQDDKDENEGQGLNQTLAPQPNQQAPQQPQQPDQQQTSSASPTVQASAPSAQPNQKAGSGNFTNIRNYIQANQGNRIASAASQKVTNLAQGANKSIQQANIGFQQKVDQGTLKDRQNALQDVSAAVASARNVQAQQPTEQAPQYINQDQSQRFADVINARYQGPESLRQSGLLEPASKRVQEASRQIQNTGSAQGREELLRSMFARNRDYTQGQSKLDSLLLNTSQQGVNQLQQAAKAGQNLSQELQKAENQSRNLAANRASEIANIRGQARDVFSQARQEEEAATEKRINDLISTPVLDENGQPVMKLDGSGPMTEWDRMPEYFRQSLANKAATNKQIQQEMIGDLKTQYGTNLASQSSAKASYDAAKKAYDMANQRLLSDEIMRSMGSLGVITSQADIDKFNSAKADLEQKQTALRDIEGSDAYKQYQSDLAEAKKMDMNQWVLSPEEAAVLGVASGEGLYNIRPDDIKAAQADAERLITQNEFARQQALAQLAGRDLQNQLQKELKYKDQTKAGTQDIQDSLDTEAFRRLLNESEQTFEDSARAAELTGTGKKKVSRGNMFGKKTKTYRANVSGNVGKMLEQAGYDFNQEPSQARSLMTDKDALANFLKATDTVRAEEGNVGFQGTEGAIAGAGTGASIGGAAGGGAPGAAIGAAVGATAGSMVGTNSLDAFQRDSDMLKELEEKFGIKGAGAVGQGIQDARGVLASPIKGLSNIAGDNAIGKALGSIASGISGIDTGAMKAFGSAKAKQNAIKDLNKKYEQYLKGQGFGNRAMIADTDTTRARTQALRDLLARK